MRKYKVFKDKEREREKKALKGDGKRKINREGEREIKKESNK